MGQGDKGTTRQGDKGTTRQGDKGTTRQQGNETTGQWDITQKKFYDCFMLIQILR